MLDDIKTIKQVAHSSFKDKETFDFQLLLDKNLYTKSKSLHSIFISRIGKAACIDVAIETGMMTVNNFFAHWIKEISIARYGTNKDLISTTTPQKIYQHSDSMLKHLP